MGETKVQWTGHVARLAKTVECRKLQNGTGRKENDDSASLQGSGSRMLDVCSHPDNIESSTAKA